MIRNLQNNGDILFYKNKPVMWLQVCTKRNKTKVTQEDTKPVVCITCDSVDQFKKRKATG